MIHLKNALLLPVIVLCSISLQAGTYLDSLEAIANGKIVVSDTKKINALLELSRFTWTSDTDSSIFLSNEALEISQKIENKKLEGDAWFNLAMIAYINGSFESALQNFNNAAECYDKVEDKFNQGNAYFQMALCHKNLNNNFDAVEFSVHAQELISEEEYYQLSYSIAVELGDTYSLIADTNNAEKSYKKAIAIAQYHEDNQAVINSLKGFGEFYIEVGQYNKAVIQFGSAIKLTPPSNKQLLSQLYNYLGESYLLKNNLDLASENFAQGLALAKESNSKVALAMTHYNLSKLYEIQQKYALALIEFKMYDAYSDSIETLMTKDFTELQAVFNSETKDKEIKLKELEIAKTEAKAEEMIQNEEFKRNFMIGGIVVVGLFGFLLYLAFRKQKKANKKLDQLSMVAREIENTVIITDGDGNIEWINEGYKRKYGLNIEGFKRKFGNNIFQNPPNEDFIEKLKVAKSEKRTVQFYLKNLDKDKQERHLKTTVTPRLDEEGEIVNFIFIDTEITDLILAEKQLTKERDNFSSVYHQVTESIDYAKRIQEAVLPHRSKIKNFFPESYLQYLPKDGVSGDFYFLEETDDYIYLAGADCTGHGVPGALMSVICHSLLETAVHRFTETNEILCELNKQLIKKLKQGINAQDHIKDGLDIALVRISKKQGRNLIQYSGAHSGLYLVSQGNLEDIKPSKIHLGHKHIQPDDIEVVNKEVIDGTELVFFSDGFPDQKGGSQSKKFYYAPFRELIRTVNQLPQEEKLKHLNKVFNKWKIGNGQTDDVLVWGLKIKL